MNEMNSEDMLSILEGRTKQWEWVSSHEDYIAAAKRAGKVYTNPLNWGVRVQKFNEQTYRVMAWKGNSNAF